MIHCHYFSFQKFKCWMQDVFYWCLLFMCIGDFKFPHSTRVIFILGHDWSLNLQCHKFSLYECILNWDLWWAQTFFPWYINVKIAYSIYWSIIILQSEGQTTKSSNNKHKKKRNVHVTSYSTHIWMDGTIEVTGLHIISENEVKLSNKGF